MPSKQPDTYDTIFDFIFATREEVRKKGGPEEAGVNMPDVSGLGGAFAQIAINPVLYPVENLADSMGGAMNDIGPFVDWKVYGREGFKEYEDGLVGDMGSVDYVRFRIRPNEAASFVNDPRGYVNKAVAKYKAGLKWHRIGAFTRAMSAAQFGIWSNQALKGAGIKDASQLSGMVAQTMNGGHGILGDSAISDSKLLRTSYNLVSDEVVDKYGVSKKDIDRAVRDSFGKEKKVERWQTLSQELKNRGVSDADAEDIATRFWGPKSKGDDLGIFGDDTHKVAVAELVKRLESERNKIASSDPRKAKQIQGLINGLQHLGGSWGKVKGGPLVVGQFLGKAAFTWKWMQGYAFSGVGFSMMMSGQMFSPGVGDNIFRILKKEEVGIFNGKGKQIDSEAIWVGADGTPQRALAFMQYAHPANIVKGLLWDGRHYKWLAQKMGKGKINTRNLFYQIYKRMPGVVLSRIAKNVKDILYEQIVKRIKYQIAKAVKAVFKKAFKETAKELAELTIKAFLTKILSTILTQLLGSIVPGIGNAAAIIVDIILWIGSFLLEKLIGPILQFIALIIMGIIALFLIQIGFIQMQFSSVDLLHRHLGPPFTGSEGYDPGETEWADDSVPDGNYNGACPAPGASQRCTQGSSGDVSAYHNRTRAVDFGLNAGTPIVAPHDGQVEMARSESTCGDGTNYGGTIRFRETVQEDGSGGHLWHFLHVRPAVSSGQNVSKGDVLGYIDGPDTADYSDSCWTGPHLHVHVQDSSGAFLDSEVFLNEIGCNFTCP